MKSQNKFLQSDENTTKEESVSITIGDTGTLIIRNTLYDPTIDGEEPPVARAKRLIKSTVKAYQEVKKARIYND